MSIGSTVKRLRLEKNITQEQLAEYLSITSRAISQWECDRTAPDISMLPQLADFFEITVDELLGVDEQEKNRIINDVVAKTSAMIDRNITEEPIKILRETLKRYPNNDRLLCTLMYALYAASEDPDFCKEHDTEIVSIADRIFTYSKNDDCRGEARRLLFRHYCDTDRKSEARVISEEMPNIETCYERNTYWMLDGDERLTHLLERISDDLRALTWDIWAYSVHSNLPSEEKDELEKLYQKIEYMVREKFSV